jgi:hypothetical protein
MLLFLGHCDRWTDILSVFVCVCCSSVVVTAVFKTGPPQLHLFFQQQRHPSAALSRLLPHPLAVYDTLPDMVDPSVVEAERPTYWWYGACITA